MAGNIRKIVIYMKTETRHMTISNTST